MGSIELDHVLIAVNDLGSAAEEFERRHGLAPIDGGRHPSWGTENRIIPLGDAYLELIGVVDAVRAAATGFGRWVRAAALAGDGLLGWAVRTDDLDPIAARLGLEVDHGERTRADGTRLAWRMAGLDRAAAEHSLPFFVEWADASTHPGKAAALQGRIERLTVEGDPERLGAWLGPHTLPLQVTAGSRGLTRVDLVSPSGGMLAIGG